MYRHKTNSLWKIKGLFLRLSLLKIALKNDTILSWISYSYSRGQTEMIWSDSEGEGCDEEEIVFLVDGSCDDTFRRWSCIRRSG